MIRRGILNAAGPAALLAALVVGCSSAEVDGDAAPELVEMVLEEAVEAPVEPEPEGEVEASGEGREGDPAPEESADVSDVDITTVPDEITVEYVQAVLDELERIYAEALVIMMEEGELTLEVSDRLGEIFAQRQVDLRRQEFIDAADAGFPDMRPPDEIELRRREVVEILDEADGCIYVETVTDDSSYFSEPRDPVEIFVLLEPHSGARPVDINSTDWAYGSLGGGELSEMRGLSPCADR